MSLRGGARRLRAPTWKRSMSNRPARLRAFVLAITTGLLAGGLSQSAVAQERFAGQWTVAGAVPGPWAHDPKNAVDEAEAQRFLGKTLTIGAHVFGAPEPLGCAKPTYSFRNAKADTLFEGSLNADGADKPTDPVAAASALGITQKSMRGMTASCSEVEFFLTGPDTFVFGLNNRVFTAKRVK
jgi:hypothetical protein